MLSMPEEKDKSNSLKQRDFILLKNEFLTY